MPPCEHFARTEISNIGAFLFMKTCKIKGCKGKGSYTKFGVEYFSKGYCKNHYYRYNKYGDATFGEKEKHTKCKVEGCNGRGSKMKEHHNEIFILGYCAVHHKRFKKHGDPNVLKIVKGVRVKDHPLNNIYRGMKTRCYNKKDRKYRLYGGRGIVVCGRWLGENGFKNFVSDMGERPKGTSLDRFPNKDGNYEPLNCRWANIYQQNRNRNCNNKFVGVMWSKREKKWISGITINTKYITLGKFKEYNDAVNSRKEAEIKYGIKI